MAASLVLCCRCCDCCLQSLHKKQRRRNNYFAIKAIRGQSWRTLSFRSSRTIPRDVRSPTQITVSFYGYLKMHKRIYNGSFFFACLEVISQLISEPAAEITVMARWGKVEFQLHGESRKSFQLEEGETAYRPSIYGEGKWSSVSSVLIGLIVISQLLGLWKLSWEESQGIQPHTRTHFHPRRLR